MLLLLAGAATAVGVNQHRDGLARDRAVAAAEREERRADNAAEDAQEESDEAERSVRRDLVKVLEKQITKYAMEKVAEDLLEGPINCSSCTATGGGSTDILTALTGTSLRFGRTSGFGRE